MTADSQRDTARHDAARHDDAWRARVLDTVRELLQAGELLAGIDPIAAWLDDRHLYVVITDSGSGGYLGLCTDTERGVTIPTDDPDRLGREIVDYGLRSAHTAAANDTSGHRTGDPAGESIVWLGVADGDPVGRIEDVAERNRL